MELFTFDGVMFLARWAHFLAGVCWIGMLWYFNFVQGSFFAEADGDTKKHCTQKLVPRALWWFRWGAMFTFLSGVTILGLKGHDLGMGVFSTSWGTKILTGALMGTIMWANVWFIIWPAQKIVIAAANGQNIGDAASAGARAGLASRTNTFFSIPMLFFMGAASHFPLEINEMNLSTVWAVNLVIILGLGLNGAMGKMGPLKTVRGVITSGFVLTAVLYTVMECLG